jgi:drug/metabolite transporter (DMT)-like permease
LASSILTVLGLLLLKRAQAQGTTTWTTLIVVTWTTAVAFSALTLIGGTMQPLSLVWQPALVGALFLAGLTFTFLGVQIGDVSIVTPVQGVKVLLVPALAVLVVGDVAGTRIWLAAAIAMGGIWFIQSTDETLDRSKVRISIGCALLAAVSLTLFDLLIQKWAPAWGPGYFLPLAFASTALLSLGFLKLARPNRQSIRSQLSWPLAIGALLMAVQAFGMTYTIAQFGDATRVNIVYSLRGLWGVLLTWTLAKSLGLADTLPASSVMLKRLAGAILIGASIALSLV